MRDWKMMAGDNITITWSQYTVWFESLPIFGQIFVIVAFIALMALITIAVYYILKGTAYLVYYILKGTFYLVGGIFYINFKLFEALYYLISGKPRPPKKEKTTPTVVKEVIKKQALPPIKAEPAARFCSECGCKISNSFLEQLSKRGVAYCSHCGQSYEAGFIEMSS